MRMTEAQLRKVIRKEILREMHDQMPPEEEEGKLYPGAIAGGAATGLGLAGLVGLLNYVQTHPIGGEMAMKIGELSQNAQHLLDMLKNAFEE